MRSVVNTLWRTNRRTVSVALAVVVVAGAAQSAPLPPEVCANLKTEIAALEQGGLRVTIARGPETAKSTLTPEQFNHIRRLLDADAQVKFRCPANQAASLLKDVAPEDNPDAPGYSSETEVGGAAVPAKPAAKPAVPKVAVQKPAVPKDATAPATDAAPAKAVPKPKPAVKANDAYSPPATGDANGTPLQQQAPAAKATPPG